MLYKLLYRISELANILKNKQIVNSIHNLSATSNNTMPNFGRIYSVLANINSIFFSVYHVLFCFFLCKKNILVRIDPHG